MTYSEIFIGQTAEVVHTITAKDIDKFAELTGDDNRLHVDATYAKKTAFKKQVAHGMLGASFISTVIGTKLPGDGALWFSQSLEFLLPVRIGDTITVIAEVLKKNDREESIELSTVIFNQNKQKVTTGNAKVKIIPFEKELEDHSDLLEDVQKTALVVGASGGIGLEVTKQLLQEGFNVIGHYNRNKTGLNHLKNSLKNPENLMLIQSDLTSDSGVDQVLESVNRYTDTLDALVYTSSPSIPNIDFQSLDWQDFAIQIKLHVEIPFLLTQRLEDHLSHKQAGVVFITTQSIEQPFAKLAHYTTAKGALLGLTKSLATDLASKKIRVNAVSPSIADTDLNADLPKKIKLLTAAKTPLKRLAAPEDIAQAIVFLADSTKSGFITGETIRINGGQVMW
ncbi:SDR family oxidoreductase [Winogradskyella eckloniae]|uniref:SDR family oxidoreductase n=1 Tax=Winogradskyella eckloniae TaxID=1089306 RepID=UPI001563B4EC|nr:SDR family oxidoreductase [Winogradskyella eckloniae]NRD20808.1 SDR family oxidoreductase [Winogradskyella eckloniae]